MTIDVINNLFITFKGAIISLVVMVVYLLFLIYMTRKHPEWTVFVQKTIKIVLAFVGWLTILVNKANTISELFDSTWVYYFAMIVAAVAVANTCIDFWETKPNGDRSLPSRPLNGKKRK